VQLHSLLCGVPQWLQHLSRCHFSHVLSVRLARVDFALTSPEVETNMCGTGEDTITTKEMRQRKHPFSSIDPIYDILVAGVKHVLFLNTTILTRRAIVSIVCGIQVVPGIAILYAVIKYEQYFNHIQAASI